jgi:glycosyltransferase involved in cell wall biosynthesis
VRVLIASDHYPPGTGGAERQTQLLGRAFHSRGDAVAIAVPRYPGVPAVYDDEGVAVHGVGQLRSRLRQPGKESRHHAPPFADPVMTRELRRLVRTFAPDLVQSHGWITYSVAAALKGTDIPLLATARDYGFFCATRTLVHDGARCDGPGIAKCMACAGRYYGGPKGWLAATGVLANRARLRRRLAGIHSISSFVADSMNEHLIGAETQRPVAQFVLPSFLDESCDAVDGDAVTLALERLPDEPFLLYVGAFRAIKGVNALLEAYAQLADPPPLVMIGSYGWDGPSEFPSNVTTLAKVPHAAVMAAWDRALFGVMPSLLPEPFGSVVHEAMSRGKPVIGTTPGGHCDMIVDGENGLLVSPGDVRALRRAMEFLLADPERRARMGRAAQERAREFSADNVLPRFFEAFASVTSRDEGAPDQ